MGDIVINKILKSVTHNIWIMNHRLLLSLASNIPMKFGVRIYRALGVKIGNRTEISRGFYVDRCSGFSVGSNSFLNYGVHCYCGGGNSQITIGNNVFIGPEVSMCCASHEIGGYICRAGKNTYDSITVGDGCWIGMRSVILPGVNILDGCIIAAGSVVTKSTEPNALYAGVPARKIKDLPL